jgi:predicted O-methyltransferase YrrM
MCRDSGLLPRSANQLALLFTQYRSLPLYQRFKDLNSEISMLHPDVLVMLYHYGMHTSKPVLELGPYLGGSTVAIALGLKQQEDPPRLVTVEVGGSYDHPSYATSDIVAGLRANLTKYDVADRVEVLVGSSRDRTIVSRVNELLGASGIGCLMIDTDGRIDQDLDLYGGLLAPNAYLIVDDYYAPGAPEKEETTRAQIDRLESDGVVESFGVHGWGTWFGRFK